MHQSYASRKVLIAAIIIVALSGGVVYYFSLGALAPSVPPTNGHSEWRLSVEGLVQRPLNLSMEEIRAMPKSETNAELYCLPSPGHPGIRVDSGNWTGVRLGYILEEAGVLPEAVKVAFFAEDGFTTDLTLAMAMREDVILAYEKDGEPLAMLRLAAPGMWGYKWIKWLLRIEIVNYDFKGSYESRSFPDDASIP